jgi:hypothetical protein
MLVLEWQHNYQRAHPYGDLAVQDDPVPDRDPDSWPDEDEPDDDGDDDDELQQSTRTCPACGGLGRLKDGTRCARCKGSGRIGRNDIRPGDRSGGAFNYGSENLDDWTGWS